MVPTPNESRSRHCARHALLLAALSFTALTTGCMHRRMTITSNPPGARVLVDGEDIGLTPASMDFLYYGTREITLIRDGYETHTVMQKVPAPWYQVPPLDFISDNFLPFRVTNRHRFHYELQRQQQVPQQSLLDRANGLRSESQFGR